MLSSWFRQPCGAERLRYRSQLTFAQLVKAGQALLARSEIPSLPSRSQSSPCCPSLQAVSVATTFRGSVLAPFMTRPKRTIHQECPERESNPHTTRAPGFESGASANSAIRAKEDPRSLLPSGPGDVGSAGPPWRLHHLPSPEGLGKKRTGKTGARCDSRREGVCPRIPPRPVAGPEQELGGQRGRPQSDFVPASLNAKWLGSLFNGPISPPSGGREPFRPGYSKSAGDKSSISTSLALAVAMAARRLPARLPAKVACFMASEDVMVAVARTRVGSISSSLKP